jgi:hypothetical protein
MKKGDRKILARSIPQFCADTSLGRTLVYADIAKGKLRVTKVGRRSIITDEDGKAYLASLDPSS